MRTTDGQTDGLMDQSFMLTWLFKVINYRFQWSISCHKSLGKNWGGARPPGPSPLLRPYACVGFFEFLRSRKYINLVWGNQKWSQYWRLWWRTSSLSELWLPWKLIWENLKPKDRLWRIFLCFVCSQTLNISTTFLLIRGYDIAWLGPNCPTLESL